MSDLIYGGTKSKCFLFSLILCFFVSSVLVYPIQATDGYYDKEYKFSYGKYDWTFTLSLPKSLYDSYKGVPVNDRIGNGPQDYGFLTTTQDPYLIDLTDQFTKAAKEEGYSEYETVSFVLAFVQSLPYTSDSSSAAYDEYPRFPIETLVDDGGDCEDTSILFATIMTILGYGVIFISPPEHLAVGILGEDDLPGYYWTYDDRHYYYCETTGDGFEIGELPSEVDADQDAYLYLIDVELQYHPNEQSSFVPTYDPNNNSDLSAAWGVAILAIVIIAVLGIIVVLFMVKKRENPSPFISPNTYSPYIPPPPPMNYKFCPYCGKQNEAFAIYCEQCNHRF